TVFIDAQNFFKQAQRCFGDIVVSHENYDPLLLANHVVAAVPGGILQTVRYYSGLPWMAHGHLGEADLGNTLNARIRHYVSTGGGIFIPTLKQLAYRPPRTAGGRPLGREKGIDVAIAIDVVMGALDDDFDAAIIVSQDKDLNDISRAVGTVRKRTGKWKHLVSAFNVPVGAATAKGIAQSGITGTFWVKIDRTAYEGFRASSD